MRCYLIEDIAKESAATIADALDARGWRGPIDDIWYLPVAENLLSAEQKEHFAECGPYMMALERIDNVEDSSFKLELLVRAQGRMRCSCVAYAAPVLREQMIDLLDAVFREHDVSV